MSSPTIPQFLQAAINQLFPAFAALDPKPYDYLFYARADREKSPWIIMLFFADAAQLKTAIKSGACYELHKYFLENLKLLETLKEEELLLVFESGEIPREEEAVQALFAKTNQMLDAMEAEAGQENPTHCSTCGHDFSSHQIGGIPDEKTGAPVKGWVMCPEEDCTCFRVWDKQLS